ncbi:hypothetical protein GVN21_11030 [Caulobacter sp. SLTY]|uniref:FG-GAP-like repeat-containing protein n=1 Tax=Caulobacter sp. SLTY TaxID=2683262 RepID=UPI00141329E0|nr:FG-GAP-like repeat-containing protein [Caulobacter sp. SLTY]NBB15889.1 hypothetical protein [Caulobacter sp. SLTY]
MPFPSIMPLTSLTSQTGRQINGTAAGAEFGAQVLLEDFNGDGFIDLAVSASGVNGYAGAAYVIFGTASGIPTNIGLADLNGTNGFVVTGRTTTAFGAALAAGDVNGDGIQDLLISGFGSDGLATVVFGQSGAVAATRAYTVFTGANGFNFNRQDAGYDVSAGGDINGDGIDDLVVSHHSSNAGGASSGAAYVVFGKTSGWASTGPLSGLDGSNGFRVVGSGGDFLGQSLEVMDINGDGIDDLLMGAPGAVAGAADSGAVYVVYGKTSGWAASLSVGDLDGVNGMTLTTNLAANLGRAVTNLGDINGDGREDVGIISSNTTTSYVLYGRASSGPSLLALNALDGSDGFQFTNAYTASDIVNAGDVNGDGYDDLLVGSAPFAGSAYVLFGSAEGWAAVEDLRSLNGQNGFTIIGEANGDLMGRNVSGGHDLNGDGLDDIVIGARGHDAAGSFSGAAYIIYGQQGNISRTGTAAAETLTGNIANDTLSGLDGKDLLYGLAGNDTLLGGAGGDLLDGGAGADAMSGGTGDDTYIVDDAGDLITELGGEGIDRVRSTVSVTLAANVDNLNLEGSGDINGTGNSLVNQITGNSGANRILAGGGADLVKGGLGNDDLNGEAGADHLLGEGGADTLNGGDDNDRLDGGAGDDILNGGAGLDILDGGADSDTLNGDAGADQLSGGEGADILNGGADNDVLDGGAGADSMTGGTGDDTYTVDNAGDTVTELAAQGTDQVRAGISVTLSDNVEILILTGAGDLNGTGNGLANTLNGNNGANTLDGLGGNDLLKGGLGADTLIGGLGADILVGGGGADSFVVRQESIYSSANPAGRVLEIDTISDYAAVESDRIDLSAIDAIAGGADDAFLLVGAFNGQAGQMTLSFAGGVTSLSLDVDGDGRADYLMKINGNVTGQSGSWLL